MFFREIPSLRIFIAAAIIMNVFPAPTSNANKVFFDSGEIRRACAPDMLDIPIEGIPVYFFTPMFR